MRVHEFIFCMVFFGLVALSAQIQAQTSIRRSRGEGFYACESANTPASGSVWASGRVTGYIWDAKADSSGITTPVPKGLMDLRLDIGMFDLASVTIQTQPVAFLYGAHYQYGNVIGAAKFTYPDNKDLRLFGFGAELAYIHSFVQNFNSLGGYRDGGSGFGPNGIMVEGGTLQAKYLFDIDALAKYTWLPLKALFNGGARMPLNSEFRDLSQYILQTGVGYVGLNVDVFVEYSLEAFFNRDFSPKRFTEYWWRTNEGLPISKTWEVAFSENPMYLIIGGRYRYEGGTELCAYVPLLLSTNQGSTMGQVGHDLPPGEQARDITDGFDPWYAQWKVVLQMTVPLYFRETGAEMRRNFLLLKNTKSRKHIDMDERIKIFENKPQATPADTAAPSPEADKKERLDTIKKRRQEVQTDQ